MHANCTRFPGYYNCSRYNCTCECGVKYAIHVIVCMLKTRESVRIPLYPGNRCKRKPLLNRVQLYRCEHRYRVPVPGYPVQCCTWYPDTLFEFVPNDAVQFVRLTIVHFSNLYQKTFTYFQYNCRCLVLQITPVQFSCTNCMQPVPTNWNSLQLYRVCIPVHLYRCVQL